MINAYTDVLGIMFPNSYDSLVPELVTERLMASIPFAGRYRVVDFLLSSMVNCGIDNVSLIVRNNYHSLMDHLGSGREWDLNRKNGGLNIVPPFAHKSFKLYSGRVQALGSILGFLESQREKYVVLTDVNLATNFDFKALMNAHVANGADVTVAYTREEIPRGLADIRLESKDLYYTLDIAEDGRIQNINVNSKEKGVQNLSMNIYFISRELLIKQIRAAYVQGHDYFERDILVPQLKDLKVHGYLHEGYTARITSIQSFFDENMKMLEEDNLDALFSPNPVYTKIRDDNPTRYIEGANVQNIMAADGCLIEGTVENSILFRGVKVGKGAVVKNCVLMQDTVVESGATLEYVIADKDVVITEGREIKGTETFPVFVEKARKV